MIYATTDGYAIIHSARASTHTEHAASRNPSAMIAAMQRGIVISRECIETAAPLIPACAYRNNIARALLVRGLLVSRIYTRKKEGESERDSEIIPINNKNRPSTSHNAVYNLSRSLFPEKSRGDTIDRRAAIAKIAAIESRVFQTLSDLDRSSSIVATIPENRAPSKSQPTATSFSEPRRGSRSSSPCCPMIAALLLRKF